MSFKEKLFELRTINNYSIDDLAFKLNVSILKVIKWEEGLSYPSIDNLEKIAKFFNVSIDYILSNNDIRNIAFNNRIKLRSLKIRVTIYVLTLLVISIICLILNIKNYKYIENLKQERDYQIGFVVLTSDKKDEVDIELRGISSYKYPYYINDLEFEENSITTENTYSHYGLSDIDGEGSKFISASIYLDKSKVNFVMFCQVYQKPNSSSYLKKGKWTSFSDINYSSFTTSEHNSDKESNFKIDVRFIDTFESGKIYQYNMNNEVIHESNITDLTVGYLISPDCLYIVVESKYKIDDENYYYLRDIIPSSEICTIFHHVIKDSNERGVAYRQLVFVIDTPS